MGVSRMEQLQMNMEMSQAGPMKEEVVSFLDEWWMSTKHLCPTYFR